MTWFRKLLGLAEPQVHPPADDQAEDELKKAKEGLAQAHVEHKEAEKLANRLREMSRRNHFGELIGEILSKSQRG